MENVEEVVVAAVYDIEIGPSLMEDHLASKNFQVQHQQRLKVPEKP